MKSQTTTTLAAVLESFSSLGLPVGAGDIIEFSASKTTVSPFGDYIVLDLTVNLTPNPVPDAGGNGRIAFARLYWLGGIDQSGETATGCFEDCYDCKDLLTPPRQGTVEFRSD